LHTTSIASIFATAALASVLTACANPTDSKSGASTQAAVSDVQSLQQRADGSFDVICKSRVHQTATTREIASDTVCQANPPIAAVSQILSMQLRTDGSYDVICTNASREVRTAAEVREGTVCTGAASNPPPATSNPPPPPAVSEHPYSGPSAAELERERYEEEHRCDGSPQRYTFGDGTTVCP
jgi:hypothetical protein